MGELQRRTGTRWPRRKTSKRRSPSACDCWRRFGALSRSQREVRLDCGVCRIATPRSSTAFPTSTASAARITAGSLTARGQCTEQPNEPEGSTFKDKVKIAGYPVEEMGGMLFAYLGPLPARCCRAGTGSKIRARSAPSAGATFRALAASDGELTRSRAHRMAARKYQEFWEEQRGSKYAISRKHLKIDFAEFEHGMYKRRLLAGASEESDDWKVGHPVLFPDILAVGSGGGKLWKMQPTRCACRSTMRTRCTSGTRRTTRRRARRSGQTA